MGSQSHDLLAKARAAKATALKVFSGLLGDDVAVGVTRIDGEYGLKVNVVHPPPASVNLPAAVNGVPYRLEVTGRLKKRPAK